MKGSTNGRDPDFVVVGAQRAGTTSLMALLRQHPDVGQLPDRELHFFDFHFSYGPSWYRSHFTGPGVLGESSPYYLFHPDCADRVATTCPHSRVVCVLRDPIERAYSQWQWNRARGREHLQFVDALSEERSRLDRSDGWGRGSAYQDHSYISRGDYRLQLERWKSHIAGDRLVVLDGHQLFAGSREERGRLFSFLDIDPSPLLGRPHLNRSGTSLAKELRDVVEPYFWYDVLEFRDLTHT